MIAVAATVLLTAAFALVALGGQTVRISEVKLIRTTKQGHVVTPQEDIAPTIEVGLGYSSQYRRAVIEIRVGNFPGAGNSIGVFGVDSLSRPDLVDSPPEWIGFHGFDGRRNAIGWVCADTLTPPPPGWRPTLGRLSPFMIGPGDSVQTFKIYTDDPPRRLNLYAQGFAPIDSVGVRSMFEVGWRGEVVFPVTRIKEGHMPKRVEFLRPSPGLARGSINLSFALPKPALVDVSIFDAKGARVRRLIDGGRDGGVHVALWEGLDDRGQNVVTGAYVARLVVGGNVIGSQRIVVVQ